MAPSAGSAFPAELQETLAAQLLRYMLEMKHNGAIEKVQAGFVALTSRCDCIYVILAPRSPGDRKVTGSIPGGGSLVTEG